DAHLLQGRRPTIAPIEELGVAETEVPVHHRLLVRIQPSGSAGEFERGERDLHGRASSCRDDGVTADATPGAALSPDRSFPRGALTLCLVSAKLAPCPEQRPPPQGSARRSAARRSSTRP